MLRKIVKPHCLLSPIPTIVVTAHYICEYFVNVITTFLEEEKELELLQHHSFTVDYMIDNFRSLMTLMHSANQDMTPFIRLKRNLQRIDFSKILRCDLLTLEQSYREEWDKLQKELAEELSWQEKMKNRNIGNC